MSLSPSAHAMIAVALNEPTTAHARAALLAASALADIVELRLDLMDELDLPRLLAERPCPVVVTNRAAREGGRWQGSEAARLDLLRQAIDLGAEYVDVEADAIHQIRERGQSRLIASSHDFGRMPADLPALWGRLAETGADVVKLVGMARDARDVVSVMQTLAAADRPTIAIAMGPCGAASRVLALREPHCLLTFCALESGGGTAPGQLGVRDLLETYRARTLSRRTAVLGVLSPVPDDAAMARWNAALHDSGQDRVAVPLIVPDGVEVADVLTALRGTDIRLLAISEPLQEVVGQALDALEPAACRAGRVNLIANSLDGLVGGWIDGPAEAGPRLDAAHAAAATRSGATAGATAGATG
ncbi:MAG: type I 3-dehydroquinate dehydratase [Chloroflexi bacterium]|nr:type I 3-dehydroquinate dehydratase [Chloroflexota bacterium]